MEIEEKMGAPNRQDAGARCGLRADGIIPRYDMARDDPAAWERACRGLAAMVAAAWALGVALWAAGGAL